jgi:hypothetical protein
MVTAVSITPTLAHTTSISTTLTLTLVAPTLALALAPAPDPDPRCLDQSATLVLTIVALLLVPVGAMASAVRMVIAAKTILTNAVLLLGHMLAHRTQRFCSSHFMDVAKEPPRQ